MAKAEAAEASSKKKQKRKTGDELRRGLATTIEELPPMVVEHAFEATGFEPTAKPAEVLENDSLFDDLFKSLEEARRIVDEVTGSGTCKGYIFAKKREPKETDPVVAPGEKPLDLLYEDFQPFLPQKFEKNDAYTVLTFDNYNKTVDAFFSSMEGQQLGTRLSDREAAAKRKLEAVRDIQEQKVEGLRQAQMLNMRKAGALEANTDRVQEAMDAVNGLIAQGMDWVNIGKLIEREQKRHNPVAQVIKLPLNLEENTMTLLLAEEEEEEEDLDEGYESTSNDDSEDEAAEETRRKPDNKLTIEINLGLSPYANAREYYDQRKVAAVKAQKTVEQSGMALKSAERKIAEDLKKGLKQEKPIMQPFRRQMWFEKFIWFISSDGYLVLGGRDAMQNEMLYKKYLRKGDVYVHADMHGAASIVVKNNPNTPDAPIPPSTLSQAGSFSVCSSSAWDSKAGMGAWWVNAEQVSKSAPTGEYLPSGSFMIRGNKNFLPPQPLVLGFGFLFKISVESKANHVKHRLHDVNDLPADGNPEESAKKSTVQHQDGNDSGDEHDDHENSERQNPLQMSAADDDEEDHTDDDEPIDHDVDHVKDGVDNMGLEETAEVPMMSGALYNDAGEEVGDTQEAKEEAGQSDAEDDKSEAATEAPTEAPSAPNATTSQRTNGPQQKSAPAKRGQRGKAKKAASKYKDQDDEDRAMYEELIGAAKGRQKAEAEARAKAERKAEEAARQERRKEAQLKHQKKVAEHEEVRKLMLDEGVEVLDEAEEAEATPLDALVGRAFAGDEIVEAVPMCAPWAALGKCKYKVKLQPGATKKGKAVKEILERWKAAAARKGNVDEAARDAERMWPREVELIKAAKPEEANNVVPVGKMTVMLTGGTAGGGGGGGGGKSGGKGGGQGKGGKGGKGGKKR